MAFPTDPLSTKVELNLGGTWTDITAYVKARDGIVISRGRSDESGGISPSGCRLALINRDGRFSPRNPSGPYYGQLSRNTPIRVSVLLGTPRLIGTAGNIQTPDSAALSITGDLDIRVDMRQTDWVANWVFADKWGASGQRSWRMYVGSTGNINFDWTPDGTTVLGSFSTVPIPVTSGRQALRATIDVNNGAGGRTITFYTAPTIAGPWTQLGDPVVQAGVTSIFDGTTFVGLYVITGWELYAAEIRNGIGGPLVASPTLTSQAEGALSFTDAQGRLWTKSITPEITARRYRFFGEVASWPQSWDLSGVDVTVTAEAAGVLRRLGQGASPLQGPIQRAALSSATPTYAYWPMEDADESTSIASGLPAGPAMTITGTPDLAASEAFYASEALPILTTGSAFSGAVVPHTATGTVHAHFLMQIPAGGAVADSVILRIFTSGTANRWDLRYTSTAGSIALDAYDTLGTQVGTSGGVAFAVNGKPLIVVVEMVQNGANVDWKILTIGYTNDVGLQWTGSLAGHTVGAASYVQLSPSTTLNDTVVGHLTVTASLPGDIESPLRGWAGETAARRVQRLCAEQGITFTAYGDPDESVAMGIQRPNTLLDLFAECELADLGQVFESRDRLGICYRTRDSRQYQAPALELAYTDLTELTPVEDDQATRNDITVTRTDGSSARATVDTGPLSTQPPPDGAGRYAEDVEVSLASDAQLPGQAQWRVTLGTIDEARYPSVIARLETAAFVGSPSKTVAALDADIGDLITVAGAPAWLPPDQIQQHTIGQTETLSPFEYAIDYTCMPTIPAGATGLWSVEGRWSGNGSTLAAAAASSAATSLAVATPTGRPLWTTDPADYPLDLSVGGEQVTASAVGVFATDAFTRVVAGGWGGDWTPDAGAADFSVNGTRAVISTTAGSGRTARMLNRTAVDVDAFATFDVQQTPTGATMELSLGARRTGNDRYSVSVEFTTAGQFVAYLGKNVSGVGTTFGTVTAATTYTPGTGVRVRLRVFGSTLQAKAWLASGAEPSAWGLTVTDTAITAEGAMYLSHFRYVGNTSADPRAYFDSFHVPEPQTFTVTRSVNGVAKAQTAGTAVDIHDPTYYAF